MTRVLLILPERDADRLARHDAAGARLSYRWLLVEKIDFFSQREAALGGAGRGASTAGSEPVAEKRDGRFSVADDSGHWLIDARGHAEILRQSHGSQAGGRTRAGAAKR